MKKQQRLVFFGNERLATGVSSDAPTLRALVKAGYEISAVVASHTEAVSRNKRGLEIVEIAHAYHIPVLIPDELSEIYDKLVSFNATAGILVAFGKIVPQKIIDVFPLGIINIHPSLLPEFRGPTPVETAILSGTHETGVSLMSLSAKMDAGPVYLQGKIGLNGKETKPELAKILLREGKNLLLANLDAILEGNLEPIPQDADQASYTRLLRKEDGLVRFDVPADHIERKVRAFLGFPKTKASIHGQEVIITKVRVASSPTDGHLVQKTKPGYIEIEELIAPSGRTMSGADFIRGYNRSHIQ